MLVLVLSALVGAPTYAQSAAGTVIAPKWLDTPTVDGQCNDSAYAEAGTAAMLDASGHLITRVKILHSAVDLYVCFSEMPVGIGQRVVVRVDGAASGKRALLIRPGDYEFGLTAGGIASANQANLNGDFLPLTVRQHEFEARVSMTPNQNWSAELRMRLDWLGGYARTDGLYLAVQQLDGTILQQWPQSASERSPQTWGNLVLAPAYAGQVSAGSAFMDGRGGYFVVPYAPELNPPEMTIQAWVRVVDGSCGPLLSHDQSPSYWLALCNTLRFGYAGASTAASGQTPLGEGWHNIAVTMDAEGVRTLYVDGLLDVQPGWQSIDWPVHEEQERHAELGRSNGLLRIGADPDAPKGQTNLHSYLRDLAVWRRVLSADEIRSTAFKRLTGREPGLVALWPFTHGLQDIAGGHDAGQVGNASLAREAPDITGFAELPSFGRLNSPAPTPIPTWDGRIPLTSAPIVVDGSCTAREYHQAAHIVLEPDHLVAMDLVLQPDALYLCTTLIVGQAGTGDGVTLWIDRAGEGGPAAGPTALRLRLTPDGRLVVGTGDGQGYGGSAPGNLASQVITGTRLHLQEDQRPLSAPYWSGEVRVPIAALAPFSVGGALRLAVQYQGTITPNVVPEMPNGAIFGGRWPADFDPARPATWGQASTSRAQDSDLPIRPRLTSDTPRSPQPSPYLVTRSGDGFSPGAGFGLAPSSENLRSTCGPPEPPPYNKETIEWGYARMKDQGLKWMLVNPLNPLQRAEGTMGEIKLSVEDSAGIHATHDIDMKLDLSTLRDPSGLPKSQWWLNVDSKSGSMQLESESGGFPPNQVSSIPARPSAGDHVTTLGRWVFDCSHGYTELHPLYIVEHDRLEMRPTGLPDDGKLTLVRVAQVWLNSHPDPYNSITFPGSFDFDLKLPYWPPVGEMPFMRVASGDATKVSWTRTGDTVHVSITPPAPTGTYHFEILIGYLGNYSATIDGADRAYTVWLDSIDIAHDKGRFEGGGALWTLDVNVNGTWRPIFFRTPVSDSVTTPGYPLNIPITTAEPNLTFQVTGYEGDTDFDNTLLWITDNEITTDNWHLGPLSKLIGNQKLCKSTTDGVPNMDPGCKGWESSSWTLYYHIVPGGTVPPVIDDVAFWAPRLADEPNADRSTPLGLLHVPRPGESAAKLNHPGYITEKPLEHGQIRLIDNDVDRYFFSTDEFADVQFDPLPTGVTMVVSKRWPAYFPDSIPPELQDMLGYMGGAVTVNGATGAAGDVPYGMNLTVKWRALPPDWGEAMDDCYPKLCQGRLVDLATPAAATEVITDFVLDKDLKQIETHYERDLQMDWAWQHTVGDLDYYDVSIPRAKARPDGQAVCVWDQDPSLTVGAPGMRLIGHSPDMDGPDVVTLSDPNSRFPTGHYTVTVRSQTERRGIYRLSARWVDGTYLTPAQCKRVTEWYNLLHSLAAPTYPSNWFDFSRIITWKPSPGGNPAGPWSDSLPLYALGATVPVEARDGGTIDAVILSPADRPVMARLYDLNNVLVAESGPLDATGPEKARIPDGLFPQTRLTAVGLTAGGFYLLQVVPVSETGKDAAPITRVGVSSR